MKCYAVLFNPPNDPIKLSTWSGHFDLKYMEASQYERLAVSFDRDELLEKHISVNKNTKFFIYEFDVEIE